MLHTSPSIITITKKYLALTEEAINVNSQSGSLKCVEYIDDVTRWGYEINAMFQNT